MGLRTKLLIVLIGLFGLALIGLAWLAGGLLRQTAVAITDPSMAAIPLETLHNTVSASERIIWLAAAALWAVSVGLAMTAIRGLVLAPLDRIERELERAPELETVARTRTLLVRTQQALAHYRGVVDQADRQREVQLDTFDGYRLAIEHAQAQLVVADRLSLSGEVALGAIHEIGGPLSIATACIDSLRLRSEGSTDTDRYLQDTDAALTRIDSIVSDLSALGRTSPELERRPVAADGLVKRVLELAHLHKKCRPIPIELVVDAQAVDKQVDIAARHLEQVVLNLLINAADAVAKEGQIRVEINRLAETTTIVVHDDGPGVAAERREEVFKPFYTTKAQDVGSGLGLAVSRRLLDAVDGRLEVGPSPLGGAAFAVTLNNAASSP